MTPMTGQPEARADTRAAALASARLRIAETHARARHDTRGTCDCEQRYAALLDPTQAQPGAEPGPQPGPRPGQRGPQPERPEAGPS